MPIFRIMGSAPSRAQNYPGQRRQQQDEPQQQSRSHSRHTYPGNRTTSAASSSGQRHHGMSMPTAPPRVGTLNSGGVGLIVRGANVGNSSSSNNSNTHTSVSSPTSASATTSVSSNAAGGPVNPASSSSSAGSGGGGGGGGGTNSSNITSPPSGETSRPGAYTVTRSAAGPAQVYRVTVPAGISPGSEFTVHAGPRRVRVRCPNTSRPGQSLQITLPPEPVTYHQMLKMAPLTAAEGEGGGGAVQMTQEVLNVNKAASDSGGTAQTFLVTIPPNIYPGMQFTVDVNGQRFVVTCPNNAGPNMKVRIVPPTQREEPLAAPKTQVFEVVVPNGVGPNQPFALVANGQRVLVTCPPNVSAGQKIRFQLPVQQVVGNIQLSYESSTGGWCRTIRVTDLKFQWVRVNKDDNVDMEAMEDFNFQRSAYVRKINFLEGNDARMRTGTVQLVPAKDAVVDSRLVVQNRTLLSYADIAAVQGKSLDDKTQWFQNICSQLTGAWEDGHIKLVFRRKYLLSDSVDAIMSLGREELRKRWRMEFLGEPSIDAGGVTREWFQLVSEQIFDPDFGLWLSSVNNQMCMTINPSSGISCPDDHLVYFRFLGRVMGRALFDRQLIKGHMVRHIYKHLLGWPITFEDLAAQDEEYYHSLKKIKDMEDVTVMCLDFTVTEERMGVRTEVELMEGGAMKEVTNENIVQYLEANLRYHMLDRTRPQLTELLLGFFDVIPEPALTVFDSNELELILCGLPEIDMEDWEANTIYSGLYETKGRRDKVVEWFWEVVRDDFDQELKARLLQFVTGTSGVPSRGFSVLQGNDGNIKKFSVHGVDTSVCIYPRAHTCFNRIDLPNYKSKKELYSKLKTAITLSAVGFDME